MHYALATIGPWRVLLTRPDTNAYGNAALNMSTSFHLSRHLGVPLYVAPVNPGQHQALWQLGCAGVVRARTSAARTAALLQICRLAGAAARRGWRNPWAAGTLPELGVPLPGTEADRAYFGLDLRKLYATVPLEIRLPASAEAASSAAARRLGLDEHARIVTLHIRESGYKASMGLVDREKDAARNARPETYLDAVDWLVARGYTVVRFGDPLMTPMARPGLIDLATSPARTPELEIWCVLRSRFFIASDCGPYNLSVLTGVPCLGVNITHHVGAYPLRAHDRYILKHVIDNETGAELRLGEMLTPAHMKLRWAPGRYTFRDNTPGEICEAVEEMERAAAGQTGAVRGDGQRGFRQILVDFLESDYGRRKQKGSTQPGFYLGDGWIGERFAAAHV
ncbi:MAG: TIGR04372 family glycosyltransferase [Vicinamibacterales bacterium]|nr:TIGR04372 family glycosyltransferase [Vicinamibacterales bacterium]